MFVRLATAAACVAVLSAAAPALAQVGGGIKGGLTFGQASTVPNANGALATHADFTGGMFLVGRQNARATAQIEAMLTRRGVRLLSPITGVGGAVGTIRLGYLDGSVLARIRVNRSTDRQAYVLAGPTISFRMAAQLLAGGQAADISPAIRPYDIGLTFAVGADVHHLIVESRVTLGLWNLIEAQANSSLTVKSVMFCIVVGGRF
jgi:hypothetical protein